VIDFTDSDDNLVKADTERLAEDLRLLYVALTRGVYRCYLGVFNLKVGNSKASHLQQTALGYLLFKSLESVSNEGIYQRLSQLSHELNLARDMASEGLVCRSEFVDSDLEPIVADLKDTQSQVLSFEPFKGQIEYDWKVTSYSALANGVASVYVLPGSTDEGDVVEDPALPTPEIDNQMSRFTFPKGANPGSCLHEIFENIEFSSFGTEQTKPVADALNKFGIDGEWVESTADWIDAVLFTELNKRHLSLADISNSERLVEMEFYLPMDRIKPRQINQILSEHLGRSVDVFDFIPVKGILKGYIDLIFQWQGKYFVLDYKSNHLGNTFADYGQAQMEEAMSSHHYHLQYLLYTLALHRFLKQRLPDYDYEQHIGGNYYLFLRGMDQENENFEGVYFSRPKRALIEKLDAIFAGKAFTGKAFSGKAFSGKAFSGKATPVEEPAEVLGGQQLGLWGESI
jgi:exodeoxyribonuclease V beta subunit